MNTAVVLLYGLYSPDRIDYKKYLDYIIQEIKDKNFDKVILCGGITFPHIEKISEAESVKKYLLSKYDFNKYILEDKSIDTNQNIKFASEKLNKEDNITLYCDLIRIAKVSWIAAHYILKEDTENIYKQMMQFVSYKDLYRPFTMRNLTVIGFDFEGKTKEEMIGQTFATIFDVMSLYDTDLEKLNTQQRKEDFGLKN
jgi:NDP-sugar pyrophosphorylase family protein